MQNKMATGIYEGFYLDKEGNGVSVYYKPGRKAFQVVTRPIGDYNSASEKYITTRSIKKFTSGLKRFVADPHGFCIVRGRT